MSALRVSQRGRFTQYVNNMNSAMSELMELNYKASSQKQITRPSDDPVGIARVMSYNSQIAEFKQFQMNVDTAKGWLNQADSTLLEVSTVLTRFKALAEQAATGTMSRENRLQVSFEMRQLFSQVITLANTEFESSRIFAGHKTGQPAYIYALNATCNRSDASTNYNITGNADNSILVQFLDGGTVGGGDLKYRFSKDGGVSWTQATLYTGQDTLDLNGVRVQMDKGGSIHAVDLNMNSSTASNGTWLWIRPTAMYQGDTEDGIDVDRYGQQVIQGRAAGAFSSDVMVRIDNTTPVTLAERIEYSYSLDKGLTWVTGNTASGSSGSNVSLVLPGGYLELSTSNSGALLSQGDQFMVRPQRAKIHFEVAPGETIVVNNIGKDVFGGIYFQSPCASNCTLAFGGGAKNLFETLGKLVGYVETNNQSGIQRGLADISVAQEHIMTVAADVGGRENRLEITGNMLTNLIFNKSERLSQLEDIDVAELMTQLAQQQLVYQSVLKSSSMVMQMSLLNYI